MDYEVVIQARISVSEEEIIGAKESITEALELMGCIVDHISVEEVEE